MKWGQFFFENYNTYCTSILHSLSTSLSLSLSLSLSFIR